MSVDKYLDKLTLELLLQSLCIEDRDIIVLWSYGGYSLKEIVKVINKKYKKKGKKSLKLREIGVRIHKIIGKLRENAGVRDLDTMKNRLKK